MFITVLNGFTLYNSWKKPIEYTENKEIIQLLD